MSSEDSTALEKVDELAEEFSRRLRAGENVTINGYAAEYPALAEQIRDVFPALAQIEAAAAGRIVDSAGFDVSEPSPGIEMQMEGPGSIIGNYRLVSLLGEGGFGRVFLCEQLAPVQRQVALKLIKPGMDSREVIARFEAERQALAVLDHPNIARVYDGGTTTLGRPYFVMELVHGLPMTRYCDEHRLTIRQRLELLVDVCLGIQHAHQKGIIHRDIKPSNILVTEVDGRLVCKVIDFGVSKALEQTGISSDHQTRTSQMIGTPLYMSPEQAKSGSQDVDTRSDIYSLGALFYELLTGRTPFARERLSGLSLGEIQKVILHEDPIRVALAIDLPGEDAASVAAKRSANLTQLRQLLTGELDWIVTRCLEKERERRYQSASDLADDLLRFLNDDPVKAALPGVSYRISKYIKRNKVLFVTGMLISMSLVVGIIGTTVGLLKSRASEKKAMEFGQNADAERRNVVQAQAETLAANSKLKARLEQLQNNNKLLRGIFTDFDVYRRRASTGSLESLLADRLIDVGNRLNKEAPGDEEVVSEMYYTLGDALLAIGRRKEGRQFMELGLQANSSALGPNHRTTLRNMRELAWCLYCLDDYPAAIAMARESVARMTQHLGDKAPDTLAACANLGAILNDAGLSEEALSVLLDVAKRETEVYESWEVETFVTMRSIGQCYIALGDYKQALEWLEKAHREQVKHLGPDHPNTTVTVYHLAKAYRKSGKQDLALSLQQDALRIDIKALGAEHPEVVARKQEIGSLLNELGRPQEAEPFLRESVAHFEVENGTESLTVAKASHDLGLVYWKSGQNELAIPLFEKAALAWDRGLLKSNGCVWDLISLLEQKSAFEESQSWRDKLIQRDKSEVHKTWKQLLTDERADSSRTTAAAIRYAFLLSAIADESSLAELNTAMGASFDGSETVTFHSQSRQDHQSDFDRMMEWGFVPIAFDMHDVAGEVRIDTQYERAIDWPFNLRTSLAQIDFEAEDRRSKENGLELVDESSFTESGRTLRAGLWMRPRKLSLATNAKPNSSHRRNWGVLHAVKDGLLPRSSKDTSIAQLTWSWHLGTREWIEYRFPTPVNLTHTSVYWFEDTKTHGCRLPERWSIQYLDGETWNAVSTKDQPGIARDQFNEVRFEPVTTTALRLEVQLQPEVSAGILEWQVFGDGPVVPAP